MRYLTDAVAEWVKSDEEKETTHVRPASSPSGKAPTYTVVGPNGGKVSGLDLPRLLSLMARLPANAPWQIVTCDDAPLEGAFQAADEQFVEPV